MGMDCPLAMVRTMIPVVPFHTASGPNRMVEPVDATSVSARRPGLVVWVPIRPKSVIADAFTAASVIPVASVIVSVFAAPGNGLLWPIVARYSVGLYTTIGRPYPRIPPAATTHTSTPSTCRATLDPSLPRNTLTVSDVTACTCMISLSTLNNKPGRRPEPPAFCTVKLSTVRLMPPVSANKVYAEHG
eukprot:1158688-Rhodomonas_salina.1